MANNSIGQFIAALRKANGMTQQDVADRLNVSNKAVSRWERGECAPDLYAIPALAEMFGVTCDELLKGERIPRSVSTEKQEPRVEKQIKNLVMRTLSGFKTLIWICLAVAVVGLVCMFGLSYGIYRPVIGFAIMLLFEVCALFIAILAVSRTKDVKANNELFEMADDTLIAKFNNTLGSLSFMAFFVIFAIILSSLPLILVRSDYIDSVMTLYSYSTIFFGGIVWILALIYLMCKKTYMAWITDNQLPLKTEDASAKSRKKMTTIQISLTLLSVIIFVLAPYLASKPTDIFFNAVMFLGLGCLLANIITFVTFLIKCKNDRKELMLPGIRNILLIPSALIASRIHIVIWCSYGPENEYSMDALQRCDSWYPEYLGYALALATIVFVMFSLKINPKLRKH